MRGPLEAGETVLLIDAKGRRYLVRLDAHATFGFHRGVIPHTDLIGSADGSYVESSGGARLLLIRPRLADYVLKMERGAQVVYPKDIGPIVTWADIGPGMTVLEAGTGSGALTLGLLRAVGPQGRVVTVERREDHHARAVKTIRRWLGELPDNLEMRIGEVEDALADVRPERIVLDLPEPWHAARIAADQQPSGGVLACYLPTVPQVQTLVETFESTGAFAEVEVFETLHRTWNVKGRSVRPSHQMVGHTGFVVTARRVEADDGRYRVSGVGYRSADRTPGAGEEE